MVEASGDRVTWAYDALYQLTRERRSDTNAYDITYTYDCAGNRLTKLTGGATTTYAYDAANELTTETTTGGVTTYSYDADGNVTVKNAAGSRTTHTWDGESRLAVAALAGGGLVTSAYDATGLRRTSQTSSGTTKFIWDGQNVLMETDGGGTTQVLYTQAPGLYGRLVSQRRGGTSSFFHFDALGSTTELTSAAQVATDSYRYYAFGEALTSSGSTTNPFRFVGRLGYYNEPTLALQYLRARWYQPSAGRFLCRDPLGGLAGSYPYLGGSPAASADPSGLVGPGVLIACAILTAFVIVELLWHWWELRRLECERRESFEAKCEPAWRLARPPLNDQQGCENRCDQIFPDNHYLASRCKEGCVTQGIHVNPFPGPQVPGAPYLGPGPGGAPGGGQAQWGWPPPGWV
jgi:RHS repeat-associated protein